MKRITRLIIIVMTIVVIVSVAFCAQAAPLAPKSLAPKDLDANPYMSLSEANIHNDCYNSDVTDEVLPLGIYPEINVAMEKVAPNASPAIFFDQYNHAVAPLLGGIAIRDMNAPEVTTLGAFIPSRDDGGEYSIQVSYSFVDNENRLVCPTSDNYLMILKTMDDEGNVLPVFEKLMYLDIKTFAEMALGKEITQKLLSVVYDFDGNLWFATGGFRIYPDRGQTGVIGYVSRETIERYFSGETFDPSSGIYFYETAPGEAVENGIASSRDGVAILTNQACYLFRSKDGVEMVWRSEYGSVGAKGDENGGGLAWGGGSSPTLTNDLVCFTDNLNPINLIAIDIKTGETVAKMPVLDDLPEGTPVSVENSIIVYDDGVGTTSAVICNWYGASNPGLANPDSDSSIQTYENIYNMAWITGGNKAIMPGMERADIVKTPDGYEIKSVWSRDDIRDTSMFKLSTATGYLYGYVQDMQSLMWQYITLDFDTGETVMTADVSSKYGYNNMAIGMFCGSDGNSLYCPTGYRELLRLQDRFAYLPEMPYREIDLDLSGRKALTGDDFAALSGVEASPVTFLNAVTVENVHPSTVIAFRATGLQGDLSACKLYAMDASGQLNAVDDELWSINQTAQSDIVEILVTCLDGGDLDLSSEEKTIKISVILADA